MDILEWLTGTETGKWFFTLLVSMVPVIELRGAIPFGHNVLRLGIGPTLSAAVIGNLLPVPFIIVYIRRIFQWMRRRLPRFGHVVDALEEKAHLKGRKVSKYKYLGLAIFVGVPLPGTGAWTGSLAAAFLDMPLRRAIPSVVAGVVTAGVLISALSFGVGALVTL